MQSQVPRQKSNVDERIHALAIGCALCKTHQLYNVQVHADFCGNHRMLILLDIFAAIQNSLP